MDKKFNATKHGILSRRVSILPGETKYGFRKLKQSMLAEYQPQTDIEAALVDYLTICFWRLKRALRVENKIIVLIENEFYGAYPSLKWIKLERLEQIMRYIGSIRRDIFNTRQELERIRTNKSRDTGLNSSLSDTDLV